MIQLPLFKKGYISFKAIGVIVALCVVVAIISAGLFRANTPGASAYNLPAATKLLPISESHSFPILRGIRIDIQNPLNLEFIVDTGDKEDVNKEEAARLIRYFLAGLTLPEEELWVNLSPYEEERVVSETLALTDLGKEMLGQDYVLKQLLSSLTYPEGETGKNYWQEVYEEVAKIAGTTNIPINTFNKVWVMPDKATVYENDNLALITEANLKTMLEEDYLAFKNQEQNISDNSSKAEDINKVASKIMRKVVLPKINRDVNKGKNFATLRQIYHSLILSVWFKERFKDTFYVHYIDQGKIKGIELEDTEAKDKIYNLYVEAYKKGVYDYVRQDYDEPSRKFISRRYYSGGLALGMRLGKSDDKQVSSSASEAATIEVTREAPEGVLFAREACKGRGKIVRIKGERLGRSNMADSEGESRVASSAITRRNFLKATGAAVLAPSTMMRQESAQGASADTKERANNTIGGQVKAIIEELRARKDKGKLNFDKDILMLRYAVKLALLGKPAVSHLIAQLRQLDPTDFKDSDIAAAIIDALGIIGPSAKAAIPTLAEILRRPNTKEWVAGTIIRTLGVLLEEDPRAIPILVEALEHEDRPVQEFASEILSQAGKKTVPYLMRVLHSSYKDQKVKRSALEVLENMGAEAQEVISDLIEMVDKLDREEIEEQTYFIRESVIPALSAIGAGNSEVKSFLLDLASDHQRSNWVRIKAMLSLGKPEFKKQDVVNVLQSIMREAEDLIMRMKAAESLALMEVDVREFVPVLVALLQNQGTESDLFSTITRDTIFAMGDQAKEVAPILYKLFNVKYQKPHIKRDIALALSFMKTINPTWLKESIAFLVEKEVSKEKHGLRGISWPKVCSVNADIAIPMLIQEWARQEDDGAFRYGNMFESRKQKSMAELIARVGKPAVEPLIGLLSHRERNVRVGAGWLLARLAPSLTKNGDIESFDPLRQNIIFRGDEVSRQAFTVADMETIYTNQIFQQQTKSLGKANQFSVARSIYDLLRNNLATEINNRNIERVLPFVLKVRKRSGEEIILDKHSEVMLVFHEHQDDFDERDTIRFLKRFGVTKIKTFRGQKDKQQILGAIERGEFDVLWFVGHGIRTHLKLGDIAIKEGDKNFLHHPNGISYLEIADKLVKRENKRKLQLVTDACLTGSYGHNLKNSLIQAEKPKGFNYPPITTATNREAIAYGEPGYGGSFLKALEITLTLLEKETGRPVTKLKRKHLQSAEEILSYSVMHQDPMRRKYNLLRGGNTSADTIMFVPLTAEEKQELKQLKEKVQAKKEPSPVIVVENEWNSEELRVTAINSFQGRSGLSLGLAMLEGTRQVSSSVSDDTGRTQDVYGGLDFTHESFDLTTYGDGINTPVNPSSESFSGLTFTIITIDDLPSIFLE